MEKKGYLNASSVINLVNFNIVQTICIQNLNFKGNHSHGSDYTYYIMNSKNIRCITHNNNQSWRRKKKSKPSEHRRWFHLFSSQHQMWTRKKKSETPLITSGIGLFYRWIPVLVQLPKEEASAKCYHGAFDVMLVLRNKSSCQNQTDWVKEETLTWFYFLRRA